MKSTWTKTGNSEGELVVEIDQETWKKAQEKAFNKIAQNAEIPGFRKGQAPKALIRKQIREESVMYEAIDSVAVDALYEALEENQLQMIAQPSLDIQSMTADALTLLFKVTVAPEVKLGEYKGFTIEKEAAVVKDEDIEERLKQMQNRYAELVLKEDGVIENGDTAIIDFAGTKDGVAFDGGSAENYSLEIGSGSFIPGFEEQLVGMKSGEEKDITVTFPENYGVEELNGAEAVFHVTVHDVKRRELPELDDEFAKEVEIDGVENLAQLKDHVLADLQVLAEQAADEKAENELLTKVVDASEVEIPEIMITSEVDQMYSEFEQRLMQQGMNMELYTAFTGQDEAAIKEQLKNDATSRVKLRLVLAQIAKEEKMEISEEETEEEIRRLAEQYQVDIETMRKAQDPSMIRYDLLIRKAYDFIKEAIH